MYKKEDTEEAPEVYTETNLASVGVYFSGPLIIEVTQYWSGSELLFYHAERGFLRGATFKLNAFFKEVTQGSRK